MRVLWVRAPVQQQRFALRCSRGCTIRCSIRECIDTTAAASTRLWALLMNTYMHSALSLALASLVFVNSQLS
jgi:hypothetical protein